MQNSNDKQTIAYVEDKWFLTMVSSKHTRHQN